MQEEIPGMLLSETNLPTLHDIYQKIFTNITIKKHRDGGASVFVMLMKIGGFSIVYSLAIEIGWIKVLTMDFSSGCR